MPGPLDALLNAFKPVKPLTPEERQMADARATQEQSTWNPIARKAADALGQVPDFLEGLTMGDPTDPDASRANLGGQLLGAAMPFAGGIKGMYSRVARAVEGFPAKINANRALNQVRQNAGAEEIGFRSLDGFLQGQGGKAIDKDAIQQHLKANPEPQLKINVKGEPPEMGFKEWYRETNGRDFPAGTPVDHFTVSDAAEQYAREVAKPTEYGAYVMPGALPNSYRETLIQLQEQNIPLRVTQDDIDAFVKWQQRSGQPLPEDLTAATQRHLQGSGVTEQAPSYRGPHFGDDPNVLVHTRHNDRTLSQRPIGPDDLKRGELRFDGGEPERSEWAFNVPGPRQHERMTGFGATEDAARQDLLQFLADAERTVPGDKGRMIENIQSDWHQAGRKKGYATPAAMAERQAQLDSLYGLELRQMDAATPVPDAPFKDTWPDLALKQQILDVANKPDLDWIGVAPSSELRARGEMIGPQFQDQRLPMTLEKLLKPFGGKLEKVDLGPSASDNLVPFHWDPFIEPQGGYRRHSPDVVGGPEDAIASLLPGQDKGALFQQLADQIPNPQAPIVRMTPEMKKQILEKGLPLMMLMALLRGEQPTAPTTGPLEGLRNAGTD